MKELIVVGMRDEIYQGEEVTGHNCDFEYASVDKIRHVLLLKTHYNKKYELSLWEEEGECGRAGVQHPLGIVNLKRSIILQVRHTRLFLNRRYYLMIHLWTLKRMCLHTVMMEETVIILVVMFG